MAWPSALEEIAVPADFTPAWALSLERQLDQLSRGDIKGYKTALKPKAIIAILQAAQALLEQEPTLVELELPTGSAATVAVVGDTHGQFHDVLKMFAAAGHPGERSYYIFNGDFVDRGAWGLETLLLFLAWKLALPGRAFLLRGNHESAGCARSYGFARELRAKYGGAAGQILKQCVGLFEALPLAAVVQRATLVLHGGLFRRPARESARQAAKRRRGDPGVGAAVGSLADLRAASKGGPDPLGGGATQLAADVLWSDPTSGPGFEFNADRDLGMLFGPDVTEAFLRNNGLRLVLRSHEGPDARQERPDMPSMLEGWSLDHDTPSGKLMTVFSAPDYPQFPEEDESEACQSNKGAVAVLRGPSYAEPHFVTFTAERPRPEAPWMVSKKGAARRR